MFFICDTDKLKSQCFYKLNLQYIYDIPGMQTTPPPLPYKYYLLKCKRIHGIHKYIYAHHIIE